MNIRTSLIIGALSFIANPLAVSQADEASKTAVAILGLTMVLGIIGIEIVDKLKR